MNTSKNTGLLTNYRIAQLVDEALIEAGLPTLKWGGPEIYNRRKTSVGLPLMEALEYVEAFVAKRANGTKSKSAAPTLAELRAMRDAETE
jgi:hypothetical protein